MAATTKTFNRYKVWYYASYGLATSYDALVFLYQDATQVGRVEFYKDGTAASSLKSAIVDGLPCVRFEIKRYADVMGLLRTEGPAFSITVNDNNGIGSLGPNDFEATGEAE